MNSVIRGVAFAAVLMMPMAAEELPGKAVYEKTCKNCHGAKGEGNPTADSFYQVRIPRLNSNSVQMLTNPELKEVILGGRGRMEPGRMGRPTAPHRKKLTDQQIADVVAYVRTLGKAAKTK